jgi:hypothetical protein
MSFFTMEPLVCPTIYMHLHGCAPRLPVFLEIWWGQMRNPGPDVLQSLYAEMAIGG